MIYSEARAQAKGNARSVLAIWWIILFVTRRPFVDGFKTRVHTNRAEEPLQKIQCLHYKKY